MKKQAFTMIELIMVIVVLGILAALALPRMERDMRQEAADNILSAIQFTQHMALMDNVETPSQTRWQRKYWRFGVNACAGSTDIYYYVGSDKNREGNIDDDEAAIDPSNGKIMVGTGTDTCGADDNNNDASAHIFLTRNYGIPNTVDISCTSNKYIGFDHLGRPHVNFASADLATGWNAPLTNDCNLTFEFDGGQSDLIITVEKETGRVYIAN